MTRWMMSLTLVGLMGLLGGCQPADEYEQDDIQTDITPVTPYEEDSNLTGPDVVETPGGYESPEVADDFAPIDEVEVVEEEVEIEAEPIEPIEPAESTDTVEPLLFDDEESPTLE